MTGSRRRGFSFLLAIPRGGRGRGCSRCSIWPEASSRMQLDALIAGAMTFVAAFATMAFLMRFLQRASMLVVFVLYRIAMGCALLYFF